METPPRAQTHPHSTRGNKGWNTLILNRAEAGSREIRKKSASECVSQRCKRRRGSERRWNGKAALSDERRRRLESRRPRERRAAGKSFSPRGWRRYNHLVPVSPFPSPYHLPVSARRHARNEEKTDTTARSRHCNLLSTSQQAKPAKGNEAPHRGSGAVMIPLGCSCVSTVM